MPRKQQNPYDTVFDFIFSAPPPKRGRPVKPPPVMGTSEIAQTFADIATAPARWALKQAIDMPFGDLMGAAKLKFRPMKSRTFYTWTRNKKNPIGGEDVEDGAVTDDLKLDVGIGNISGLVADPRGFIDRAFANYREEKKWARFGAFTRSFDAVLLAGRAYRAGLTGEEGKGIMSALLAMEHQGDTFKGTLSAHRQAFEQNIARVTNQYGVSRQDLESAIGVVKKEMAVRHADMTPHERYNTMVAALRASGYGGLATQTQIESVAAEFCGRPEKDATGISIAGSLKSTMEGGKPDASVAGNMPSKTGITAKGGEKVEKQQFETIPRGRDIWDEEKSQENLWWALQERLSYYRSQVETSDPAKAAQISQMLAQLRFFQQGTGNTPGVIVGRAGFMFRTFQGMFSPDLVKNMVNGNLFNVNPDSAPFGIMRQNPEKIKVVRDGAEIGKAVNMNVHTNSAMGVGLGWLYYFHPANLVRGLFWDGRHALRLAVGRKGFIDLKSGKDRFFHTLYRIMPGNLINAAKESYSAFINKRINNLIAKFFKFKLPAGLDLAKINPTDLLKKIITKWAAQALNVAIPGLGVVVGLVVDVAMAALEPVFKAVVGLVVLCLFAIIGILFSLTFGMGSLINAQPNLNPPITERDSGYAIPPGGGGPVQWSTADIPADYDGTCLASGYLVCTQGSSGGVSTYHQNHRSVDFGLSAGTPIYAPHDLVVESSQAQSACKDGTNYGGTMFLREINEDGSYGFRWTIYHVHPAVSSGQRVNQGELIGTVDGHATADVSNQCWTGPHAHIDVQDADGNYMDAEVVLAYVGCSFQCR